MRWALCLSMVALPTQLVAAAAPDAITHLVDGAQICASGKLNTTKITKLLLDQGWTAPGDLTERTSIGVLTGFARGEVRLFYFSSKEMTTCSVSTDERNAPVNELVTALATRLNKAPKVETPGARYLFFLPRLDILTLQVKPESNMPRIELSVVH
jgi:hypothetical protein